MTATTLAAETYGLTCTRPGKTAGVQATQEQLDALLADPRREQLLATLESTYNLPTLVPTHQAPHPREARYLVMTSGHQLLPETARALMEPSIWYALAGMN